MDNKWEGNDTDMRGEKKSEAFYDFGQLPAVISLHFYYFSAKSETTDCTWAAPVILHFWGNRNELREVDQR